MSGGGKVKRKGGWGGGTWMVGKKKKKKEKKKRRSGVRGWWEKTVQKTGGIFANFCTNDRWHYCNKTHLFFSFPDTLNNHSLSLSP
jgi:hypothetical protein